MDASYLSRGIASRHKMCQGTSQEFGVAREGKEDQHNVIIYHMSINHGFKGSCWKLADKPIVFIGGKVYFDKVLKANTVPKSFLHIQKTEKTLIKQIKKQLIEKVISTRFSNII